MIVHGTEHNYLFSCGMGDNHRGICFLKGEKTMRVHGAVGDRKLSCMDISLSVTIIHVKRMERCLCSI